MADILIPRPPDYPPEAIPAWCRLPMAEHFDGLGGCWGISHGFVALHGEPYCETCDCKAKEDGCG